ncbi:Phage-like element PBSX protein xkdK [Desulfosporosinus sp. I2]|uniref:phage tail sheath C-terminal domain-containing protein n=1 Tax=Desulfosporosinus sp. I2 TaxID=1617025 RepID=UPI0005EEF057|nr:phage tail sheath C-terminal domain-containing protein [Desulfosporosinus sp. I2]KJR48403.1 Phage-like element PBSX protein xkdK [Desulfosporosinus sp. I2]
MGLPQINIRFQTLAVTAIARSARGIVALILKDSTKVTFDTKIYTDITQIDPLDWTAVNLDYIQKAFLGTPTKVIVEREADDAVDYSASLARLINKKWNYLAIPGIITGDVATISTWIKARRDTDKKTFKAVLPNSSSDHEGIINFTTDNILVGGEFYTTAEYCARIAGILAGLPFTRSSTYFILPEVESITETATPDDDIDAGKLILINDGEHIKVGRGINSLTTTTIAKGAKFKKIKIMEAVDLMREDIRDTFDSEYVGQVNNFYDNKVLFLTAVNAYFKGLQSDEVLDPNFTALAEIDLDAQELYLQSTGLDTSKLTTAQIKEYNTGSKVFIKASGSPLDAMEDLDFSMLIV